MDYIKEVIKTNAGAKDPMRRLQNDKIIDILHGAIGLSTEAGELLDQIKKHVFYGRELDIVNIIEELGDGLWYIGLILNQLDVSFEEVMKRNIEKLRTRYPEKFTEDKAVNRDLDKEREVLAHEFL
jgi:NTP pyrophosphatase (non-canonical NTP hydrolase)